MQYMYVLQILTDWFAFQHLSNGPVSHDISAHEEQMEEMQFVLDKRAKEVERVKPQLVENSSTVGSQSRRRDELPFFSLGIIIYCRAVLQQHLQVASGKLLLLLGDTKILTFCTKLKCWTPFCQSTSMGKFLGVCFTHRPPLEGARDWPA